MEYCEFLSRLFDKVTIVVEERGTDGAMHTVHYIWKDLKQVSFDGSFSASSNGRSQTSADEDHGDSGLASARREVASSGWLSAGSEASSSELASARSKAGSNGPQRYLKTKLSKQEARRDSAVRIQAAIRGKQSRNTAKKRKRAARTITKHAAAMVSKKLARVSDLCSTRTESGPSGQAKNGRGSPLIKRQSVVWTDPVRLHKLWFELEHRQTAERESRAFLCHTVTFRAPLCSSAALLNTSGATVRDRAYPLVERRPWGTRSHASHAVTPWNPPPYQLASARVTAATRVFVHQYGLSPRVGSHRCAPARPTSHSTQRWADRGTGAAPSGNEARLQGGHGVRTQQPAQRRSQIHESNGHAVAQPDRPAPNAQSPRKRWIVAALSKADFETLHATAARLDDVLGLQADRAYGEAVCHLGGFNRSREARDDE